MRFQCWDTVTSKISKIKVSFSSSTRLWQTSVFKTFHSGKRFLQVADSAAIFIGFIRNKMITDSRIPYNLSEYVWTGPVYSHCDVHGVVSEFSSIQ